MNRRNFLNLTLPATGAVLLSNSLLNQQAYAEISRQFSEPADFDTYDVVINGAGFAGYFAAIHAARKGLKVLIVEKRSSPGYDLSAKSRLWIGAEGFEKLPDELMDLLLPVQEINEIKNPKGEGKQKSRLGNEIALFKGSIRKGLLRNLMLAKVDTLLMTDVCGVFEENGSVSGVLMACKQGVLHVKCRSFIDASDQLMLSRALNGEEVLVRRAGFVLELNKVENQTARTVSVPESYGLYQNRIEVHPGKLSDDQAFLSFEFEINTPDRDEVEHQARRLTARLGADLNKLDKAFEKAQINQYALETSLTLDKQTAPKPVLKGYEVIQSDVLVNCQTLLNLKESASRLVDQLAPGNPKGIGKTLKVPGKNISADKIRMNLLPDLGYGIPLSFVSADWNTVVRKTKQTQVIVAGGGTAGALSAAGAVEKGADTIVVDYFNDLGGTKTMGGVMGYYHGVKENTFFKKQNEEAERLATEMRMTKKIGRQIFHLKEIVEKGGQFVTSALLCGAIVKDNTVTGVLVCRHGELEFIEGIVTIDATGDGDVAAFAGASFQHGDTRIGYTQNYSQWDIAGVGKLPSSTNRDYDIIDNTLISEQQRGLLISHYEAHFYDFHPFLTVRESRRVDSVHNLDLIDCVEGTHFKDVIAQASSDFDPHNIGSSEFTKCGFLLPHSNDITVEIPYRSIVPRKVDGLLISGRGFGQTHNALQFTRMTADLIVLGYCTGQIAADIAWKKTRPRDYDVSALQAEWVQLDYLPAAVVKKVPGDLRNDPAEIKRRVAELEGGAQEYLYECSRIQKDKILPLLKERFSKTSSADGKLLLAKMLAWFGDAGGNTLIGNELKALFEEEQRTGYPDGYIDDYDFIRGREKNKLEGLFWRINQNIALLAMSRNGSEKNIIQKIIENTVSGGGMVPRTNDYFNERIDLKLIPFHNRIMNLCFYAERVPDQAFIAGFEKLLTDKNVGGFVVNTYENVRWKVHGGALELSVAAALSRCGAKGGFDLLHSYLGDIHQSYKRFAMAELEALTATKSGYDPDGWKKRLAKQRYPMAVKAFHKDIEV